MGPGSRAFDALASRLDLLARVTGSLNVVVMDAWNDLWCRARPLTEDEQAQAFELLSIALEHAKPAALPRGGHVHIYHGADEPYYAAESFAGVYVLILWFAERYDVFHARIEIQKALPEIEALTLALPPPEGPDASSGARSSRA